MSKPLLVIVGPTASGKSAFAMQVARRFGGEIICADSRTVYIGMDIGTAKPSKQDQQEVPHHLIDIREPGEPFNAAAFKQLATEAIKDISSRGKLPIMVGGTGLYVDSVIFDYAFGPAADPLKRQELDSLSEEELQDVCRQQNINLPINSRNKRHLIRAIELGGLLKQKKNLQKDTLVVGIATDTATLKQHITNRAQYMVDQGIVREVRLLGQKYGWETEAMKGNIYRIFRHVVDGTMPPEEAKQEVIKSDIRLTKRQITWFKRNPYITWGTPTELMQPIEQFLKDASFCYNKSAGKEGIVKI